MPSSPDIALELQIADLQTAHQLTGFVSWACSMQDGQLSILSRNSESGTPVSVVACGLSEDDARFIQLAHDVVPDLIKEYRFLRAHYDKRQREVYSK